MAARGILGSALHPEDIAAINRVTIASCEFSVRLSTALKMKGWRTFADVGWERLLAKEIRSELRATPNLGDKSIAEFMAALFSMIDAKDPAKMTTITVPADLSEFIRRNIRLIGALQSGRAKAIIEVQVH